MSINTTELETIDNMTLISSYTNNNSLFVHIILSQTIYCTFSLDATKTKCGMFSKPVWPVFYRLRIKLAFKILLKDEGYKTLKMFSLIILYVYQVIINA